MSNEPAVVIEPYNPAWPSMFLAERELLTRVLSPWLAGAIEHVGSTAVAGMPAKPVIDMMAPVASLEASRGALEPLAKAGYCYAPYKQEVMHWLCKPSPALRTHHLHLVPVGSKLWMERLAFRDRLRADPQLAKEYADLKVALAHRHRDDREAYTEAKGPFVERVLGA